MQGLLEDCKDTRKSGVSGGSVENALALVRYVASRYASSSSDMHPHPPVCILILPLTLCILILPLKPSLSVIVYASSLFLFLPLPLWKVGEEDHRRRVCIPCALSSCNMFQSVCS